MIWVFVGVIVVLLAVIGLLLVRQRRSQQLKQDFGPEYRRTVAEHGDQRAAEKELTDRRRRVEKFEIRPLDPASRERYSERWSATQRHFVDEPAAAVGDAHALVQEVMRDRGYPVEEDFEQRAADISVEHPNVVENYRAAHQISSHARNGGASTEQLRQSMVHFRALFDDLLSRGDEHQTSDRQTRDESDQASQPDRPGQATVADQTIRRG
ncbi:MAG: hypothetical protein JO130_19770 [Solirubrobacterales bacterium]|nr:hypothetical protein [Solirubrobacterales bacterium]